MQCSRWLKTKQALGDSKARQSTYTLLRLIGTNLARGQSTSFSGITSTGTKVLCREPAGTQTGIYIKAITDGCLVAANDLSLAGFPWKWYSPILMTTNKRKGYFENHFLVGAKRDASWSTLNSVMPHRWFNVKQSSVSRASRDVAVSLCEEGLLNSWENLPRRYNLEFYFKDTIINHFNSYKI